MYHPFEIALKVAPTYVILLVNSLGFLLFDLSSSPEKPIRIDRAARSEPCYAPVQWHVARRRLTAIVIGLCLGLCQGQTEECENCHQATDEGYRQF